MDTFRADLHCHSICSDGSLSPKQLVDLAVESNLQALAITDHDNCDAFFEAQEYARKLNISLLPGAEFSSSYKGYGVHILAYSYAMPNPVLSELCQRHQRRRQKRNRLILEKLASMEMPVPFEALGTQPNAGRPHIAQAMLDRGYVSSFNDAFYRYIGDGKPAYVQGEVIGVEETIDIIHQAGGLAILAHPMLFKNTGFANSLLDFPFDGLEGFYAHLPASREKPWIRRAEKRGWIITGGSDFHGDAKPNISLGASWVARDTYQILEEHYRQQVDG